MARIAGRRGKVYIGIASDTAAAEPLPFVATWSMKFATDKFDVTCLGDANKVYVAGLPDASGEFSGFFDDSTAQTYTAAVDGLPRKFYLYPSTLVATTYFFGTVLPDFSVDAGVDGAAKMGVIWNAATAVAKVG